MGGGVQILPCDDVFRDMDVTVRRLQCDTPARINLTVHVNDDVLLTFGVFRRCCSNIDIPFFG